MVVFLLEAGRLPIEDRLRLEWILRPGNKAVSTLAVRLRSRLEVRGVNKSPELTACHVRFGEKERPSQSHVVLRMLRFKRGAISTVCVSRPDRKCLIQFGERLVAAKLKSAGRNQHELAILRIDFN